MVSLGRAAILSQRCKPAPLVPNACFAGERRLRRHGRRLPTPIPAVALATICAKPGLLMQTLLIARGLHKSCAHSRKDARNFANDRQGYRTVKKAAALAHFGIQIRSGAAHRRIDVVNGEAAIEDRMRIGNSGLHCRRSILAAPASRSRTAQNQAIAIGAASLRAESVLRLRHIE